MGTGGTFKLVYKRVILLCAIGTIFSVPVGAANPPLCPHILGWHGEIYNWTRGAPWIKVCCAGDVDVAHERGAKVFYRPLDLMDDGPLPLNLTGEQWADRVWAKLSTVAKKPEAIGYRNEFGWDPLPNSTARHTCAQFPAFKNRLRALGYTGKVVFGSWSGGMPESYVWDEPEVRLATDAADAIETHEYFDLTVNCCSPWLCFRHRDLAINAHPDHLGNKEWFIGEFGSDGFCGVCRECSDPQCRRGWRDRGKIGELEYVNQMAIYRAGCPDNVTAVFVFQQGGGGWDDFETIGSSIVSNYIRSTWEPPATSSIGGTVLDTAGLPVPNATVTTYPKGYSAITNAFGKYTIGNVVAGTYDVTVTKSGYQPTAQFNLVATHGGQLTANFTLPARPTSLPGTNQMLSAVNYLDCGHTSSGERGRYMADGSTSTKWTCLHTDSNNPGVHWIAWDLGADVSVSGFILKNASTGGEPSTYNTGAFYIESSNSIMPTGVWTKEFYVENIASEATNILAYSSPKTLRYVRLRIVRPTNGPDLAVRIPEFEVWGTRLFEQPVRIEVENYESFYTARNNVEYWDTSEANEGSAYRTNGVDIRPCSEGGFCVSWIQPGEWLLFPWRANTTTYALSIRYAATADGQCRLLVDGVDKTGAITLPSTGGLQKWATRQIGTITVSTGWHDVKLLFDTGSFDVNYFMLIPPDSGKPVSTIANAKALGDNSAVKLSNKVVTATFGNSFWVEEADRSSGIRVDGYSVPAVGALVGVSGILTTDGAERCLSPAYYATSGTGSVPKALSMPTKSAGGSSLNEYTPGVAGGVGLNNIGLLVKIWGKVTKSYSDRFFIDDGSKRQDFSGEIGLKIASGLLTEPAVGKYVTVTGIMRAEMVGGNVVPVLMPRTQSDIVVY